MGDLTPEQRERLRAGLMNARWQAVQRSGITASMDVRALCVLRSETRAEVTWYADALLAVVADLLAEQRQGIAAAILTSTEGLSVEAYSTQWITVDDAARIAETYGGAS